MTNTATRLARPTRARRNITQPVLLEQPVPAAAVMPQLQRRHSVVSLFSGAGGLDLGFRGDFNFLGHHYERTPFDIVWANELSVAAARTYRLNVGEEIVQGDVWENIGSIPERADIVIGGFPCQDISGNGKGLGIGEGTRSGLYRALVHAVEHLQPRMFVVENVKALASKKHAGSFNTITTDFESHGY
jgi:DNA (cytosine-5)-methyltransferase 1